MENVERAFLRHKLVRESRVCFILNCFRVVWLDLITTNFCFSKLPTMLFCRHFIVSFKLGQPRVSCQPQIVLLIAKYHITTYFYAHHIFFNSPHLLTHFLYSSHLLTLTKFVYAHHLCLYSPYFLVFTTINHESQNSKKPNILTKKSNIFCIHKKRFTQM